MIGTYYIYNGNELVSESRNLITTEGQEAILQFLAGERNGFGEYMAFGIGETTPVVADQLLDFEYHRTEVDLRQPQIADSKVIVRGTIPDEKTFTVYEIGLFLDDDTIDTEAPNSVITTFDGRDEALWQLFDGATFSEDGFEYQGGRTGETSYQLDVPASTTWSLIRDGRFGSFEDLQNNDQFALAYETLAGSATEIQVRFRFDETNYRLYSFVPGAGFNVQRWTKADFTQVGTAEWNDLRSLEVRVVASGSGANVIFEGLRFDVVSGNERPVLVSRTVLPAPEVKRSTSELQIEYVLDIGFGVSGV